MDIEYRVATPTSLARVHKAQGELRKIEGVHTVSFEHRLRLLSLQIEDGRDIALLHTNIQLVLQANLVVARLVKILTEHEHMKPRLFVLPQEQFAYGFATLKAFGIQVYVIDAAVCLVGIVRDHRTWCDLLTAIEQIVPGLCPYVQEQQEDAPIHRTSTKAIDALLLLLGIALFAAAYATTGQASILLFALSYFLAAAPVLWRTVSAILQLQPWQESFLLSVATLGIVILGHAPEGAFVMLLYRVVGLLQEQILVSHKKAILPFMVNTSTKANLLMGKRVVQVDAGSILVSDSIVVASGERVPLDGVVMDGNVIVDFTDMLGEPMQREVFVGNKIMAGAINTSGILTLSVERTLQNSSVEQVHSLVQSAYDALHNEPEQTSKFVRLYTQVVFVLAALVAGIAPIVFAGDMQIWLYRALVLLVVACPMALSLSIGLSYFVATCALAKKGVLVYRNACFAALSRVKIAVFGKTGTLTYANVEVKQVLCTYGNTQEWILEIAAMAECRSTHPMAKAILQAAGPMREPHIEQYVETPGLGIRCIADGNQILVGNQSLMESHGIQVDTMLSSVAYVALAGAYIGCILFSDPVREDTASALTSLKMAGITKTILLSGGSREAAGQLCASVGIDQVHADLLQKDKIALFEAIEGNRKIFIGNQKHDAVMLASVAIGIAVGSQEAEPLQKHDVVLLGEELSGIADAITMAKQTHRQILIDTALVMAINLALMVLVIMGRASMWMVAVADLCVMVLCALHIFLFKNSVNKVKKKYSFEE